jgi:small-conductance mechanosensitive channel
MQLRQFLESGAEGLRELSAAIVDYLPRVMAAVLLVVAGWVVAFLLRALVRRVVDRLEQLVLRRTGGAETREQRLAAELAAGVVFWLVLLLFVAAATEQLGVGVVARALSAVTAYLPAALGAIVILLVAFLVADFAKRGVASAAARAGLGYTELLGDLTRIGVLVVAGVLALDQLGVDSTILVVLSATLFGGLVGGATIAFGLGARTTVSNILASHYVLQTYRVGQMIRLEGITGRMVEIRPTQILLDTPEGLVTVPAKLFSESISTLVQEES